MLSSRCALALILSVLSGNCVFAADTGLQALRHGDTAMPRSFDAVQKPMRLAQGTQEAPSLIANTGNPATAPLKWVGLFLGKDKSGKTFGCTAQFIAPRVILTAAHCIQNNLTGEWYDPDKMQFLLQFQTGSWSHRYGVQCTSRLNGWIPTIAANATDIEKFVAVQMAYQYDFAMALVDGDSTTGTFSNVALDAAQKYPLAVEIGYPQAIATGKLIQQDLGFLGQRFFPPGVLALWHSNENMTEGISGGAWIANFDSEEGPQNNVVVGMTSFYNTLWSRTTFGPQLRRDTFTKLLNYVSHGCK